MTPRTYRSGRRQAVTQGTRTRILEAARAIVGGSEDLADFSMDGVADRAGVSRMTVYNQFHSRTGLLDALADHLASGAGMNRLRDVFSEGSPRRAVQRFVEIFSGFWASDPATLRRLRAIGVLYPSLHGGLPGRDAWRLRVAVNLAEQHAPRLGFSSEASRQTAAELLSALTGFDLFDALLTAGRTPAEVTRTVLRLALTSWGLESEPVPRRPSRRA